MVRTLTEVIEELVGTSSTTSGTTSLVVDGAKVKCHYGEKEGTLIASGASKKIGVGSKPALTTFDKKLKEKDFGICKKLTEKAEKKAKKAGKPKPDPVKCKPKFEARWTGSDPLTQISGKDALNVFCRLTCKEADKKDTIMFMSNGQGSGGSSGKEDEMPNVGDREYKQVDFGSGKIWCWVEKGKTTATAADIDITMKYNEWKNRMVQKYGVGYFMPEHEEGFEEQFIKQNLKLLEELKTGINSTTGKQLESWEKFARLMTLANSALTVGVGVKQTLNAGKTSKSSNGNSKKASGAMDDIIVDGSHLTDGQLKPNTKYKTGEHGYNYKTNSNGAIEHASTDNLQLKTHEGRLPHNPKTPDKLQGDHAGHLFGDRFGGSGELDNLVSQAQNVNLSSYKKLENTWAKAVEQGKKVTVDIHVNYDSSSLRPVSFEVNYTIDGIDFYEFIHN